MQNNYFKHHYLLYNDYNLKFINNHPYHKPKFENIKFILSSNHLISQPKFIIPLQNVSISITTQLPKYIRAKNSVAAFKLKQHSIIGLSTTIRNYKAVNFFKNFFYYILPRFTQLGSGLYSKNNSLNFFLKSNNLIIGYKNVTFFNKIAGLSFDPLKENFKLDQVGGYIHIQLNNNISKRYKYYKPNKQVENIANKFIFSIYYLPIS